MRGVRQLTLCHLYVTINTMLRKRIAVFYKDLLTQKEPAREWLLSLKEQSIKARLLVRIERAESGNFGDHKAVGEGVWELRFSFGAGLRIYYSLEGDEIILLLIGGDKSSQRADIRLAKKYLEKHRSEK